MCIYIYHLAEPLDLVKSEEQMKRMVVFAVEFRLRLPVVGMFKIAIVTGKGQNKRAISESA